MIVELILALGCVTVVALSYMGYRFWQTYSRKMLFSQNADDALNRLTPKISWCRYLEHVGNLGITLSQQFKALKSIRQSSLTILQQKFSTSELTYVRFEQIIESANGLLLDNFSKLVPLLETLDNIADADVANQHALIAKIEGLLATNQQLFEKFNELIVNLSQIKSLAGPDKQTTEFLITNLSTLIERAKQY